MRKNDLCDNVSLSSFILFMMAFMPAASFVSIVHMADRICRMIEISHLLKPSMIRHINVLSFHGVQNCVRMSNE